MTAKLLMNLRRSYRSFDEGDENGHPLKSSTRTSRGDAIASPLIIGLFDLTFRCQSKMPNPKLRLPLVVDAPEEGEVGNGVCSLHTAHLVVPADLLLY